MNAIVDTKQLDEQNSRVRVIHIPQERTEARAAEVRYENGRWVAVRLDGKPRWSDKLEAPPANEVG